MKRLLLLIALALLVVNIIGVASVGAEEQKMDQPMQVELTKKQQKELSKLYNDIYKKKKKLINKYVEYGVLSKEKGERIIKHMEKRLEHIKQNGYMPHKDCHHHHHSDQDHHRSEQEE